MENKVERLNELYQDPQMAAKLNAAADEEELRKLLAENGVELTAEEMHAVMLELADAVEEAMNKEELNEDDLQQVSGGLSITSAWFTLKATGAVATAFGVGAAVGVGIGLVALGIYAYGKYKKKW